MFLSQNKRFGYFTAAFINVCTEITEHTDINQIPRAHQHTLLIFFIFYNSFRLYTAVRETDIENCKGGNNLLCKTASGLKGQLLKAIYHYGHPY